MSRQLPAVRAVEIEPARDRAGLSSRLRGRTWLRSPLADAVVDLAPEMIRLAGRAARSAALPAAVPGLPAAGANGMTVSEVEIDVASPFVRRIVVRSTNAWSVAPEVVMAGQRRRGVAGRLGLGAVSLASLALIGFAAIRRSPLALPGRLRDR